jgi:hypothetical protein
LSKLYSCKSSISLRFDNRSLEPFIEMARFDTAGIPLLELDVTVYSQAA